MSTYEHSINYKWYVITYINEWKIEPEIKTPGGYNIIYIR